MLYLANRGVMEPLMAIVVFSFIFAIVMVTKRDNLRRDKLKLMQKALEHPTLDAETKRALVESMNPVRASWAQRIGFQPLMLLVSWFGIFLGIALLAGGGYEEKQAGIVVLLLSIGGVTVPFALREFERKRA